MLDNIELLKRGIDCPNRSSFEGGRNERKLHGRERLSNVPSSLIATTTGIATLVQCLAIIEKALTLL